jgi:hypothetical protein
MGGRGAISLCGCLAEPIQKSWAGIPTIKKSAASRLRAVRRLEALIVPRLTPGRPCGGDADCGLDT